NAWWAPQTCPPNTPSAAKARSDSSRARRCSPAWSTRAPASGTTPTATPMAGEATRSRRYGAPVRVVVMLDRFPVLTETFVVNELRALQAAGHDVRVESLERGEGSPPTDLPTQYREPGDLLWLLARHPLRCTRDLFLRRRLCREEWARPLREIARVVRRLRDGEHIHVHF